MVNHLVSRRVVLATGFVGDFKRFFFRGLAAMLPAMLTAMIIVWILQFVDTNVGAYVDKAVQWIVVQWSAVAGKQPLTFGGPEEIWKSVTATWSNWHLHWLGFFLSFVLIYIFGRFVASILGRAMWRVIEHGFFRLPVVKQIYPSVKQVTDFVLAERKMQFSRVVAVEYPRKGIWSLGLVTNTGMRTIQDALGREMVMIFIPSSPTPVTGYTITVRRDEIIDLPLSIDDALRLTVSGGVIMPPSEAVDVSDLTQEAPLGSILLESRKNKEIPA